MKDSFDGERSALKKQINGDLPTANSSKKGLSHGNKEVISSIRELIDDYKRNTKALK